MASRDLNELHPHLKPIAEKFLAEAKAAGVDVLVTCTYRSNAEQTALYAQGRTVPGPIVTRAKAGQSAHNHMENGKPAAKAFDVVPMKHGKCVWDSNDPAWHTLGAIGTKLGLNWYGAPNAPFFEEPHFQLGH